MIWFEIALIGKSHSPNSLMHYPIHRLKGYSGKIGNVFTNNNPLSLFRTLKQLFDDIPPKSAPRSTTIKPKITTQTAPKMRTFSVVDFLTSQAPEENFIQPQFENDKKMGKLMIGV